MILSWLVCSKTSRALSFHNCKSCVKNYDLVHSKIVLDLLLPIMLQFFTIPPELHSEQNSVVQSIICAGEIVVSQWFKFSVTPFLFLSWCIFFIVAIDFLLHSYKIPS